MTGIRTPISAVRGQCSTQVEPSPHSKAPPRRIELPSPDRQSGCLTRCIRGQNESGEGRIRTGDPLTASQVLYPLSYDPRGEPPRDTARPPAHGHDISERLLRTSGMTGTRTPIPAVQGQCSSVEPSPRTVKSAPPTGLEPATASMRSLTFLCRPDSGEFVEKGRKVLLPLSYDGKKRGTIAITIIVRPGPRARV